MNGEYACAHGHILVAWEKGDDRTTVVFDLTGYFCPICMGAIVGHEDMIDSRILAPVQEETPT